MSSRVLRSTVALFLFGIASTLAACNTTAGAGKDISNTGKAITKAAEESKPR